MLGVGVDCSPERRVERGREISAARERLNAGLTSVSDRSRSVGYDLKVLAERLALLEREEAVCEMGGRRPSRVSHAPLTKGL